MAMNNRVLSIEIGNSFTKICEIDYKVKKPKVYKVLTVETPEGVVVDGAGSCRSALLYGLSLL